MRSATGWDACMDVASSYFVGQAMSRHSSRASRPPRAAKRSGRWGGAPVLVQDGQECQLSGMHDTPDNTL